MEFKRLLTKSKYELLAQPFSILMEFTKSKEELLTEPFSIFVDFEGLLAKSEDDDGLLAKSKEELFSIFVEFTKLEEVEGLHTKSEDDDGLLAKSEEEPFSVFVEFTKSEEVEGLLAKSKEPFLIFLEFKGFLTGATRGAFLPERGLKRDQLFFTEQLWIRIYIMILTF